MDAINTIKELALYVVANPHQFLGVALPPIVEVIVKDLKTSKERFIATMLVVLGSALLIDWHSIVVGTPQQLLFTAGLLFTESQTVYTLYFKDSFLRAKLQEKIGSKEPELIEQILDPNPPTPTP